uniref:Arf-GAP domain-containing protein n=1 Tax=Globisporangium ultimum (strain ATCC 200006 / CBS 805.95 / DAOM BR144) TaxID=431595 RepID=K3W6M0_GLOUD
MLVAVAAPAALSYSHGHVHDPRHAGLREVGGAVVAAPSTTPSKSAHMSGATEAAIRLLPGNDRCADCKAIYPQWSAVSYGILLCLVCAGRHRSLGVNVSFVKSLGMDSWSPSELRAVEVGGNAKWIAVCTATSTEHLPLGKKYQTSVATAYKSRIQAAANGSAPGAVTATEFLTMLAGETNSPTTDVVVRLSQSSSSLPAFDPPVSPPSEQALNESSSSSESRPAENTPAEEDPNALSVKCTTCKCLVPMDQLDSHSKQCVVSTTTDVVWQKYECELGVEGQPLGFSLAKTEGGFAEVCRVAPGGEAEKLQVLVGSYVVGLNDVKTSVFDEIVDLVRRLPRPIQFRFVCRSSSASANTLASGANAVLLVQPRVSVASAPTICSVPEPVSIAQEITFTESELGCLLQVCDYMCVVQHVETGGAAHQRGVLVGSKIVEVNGRRFHLPQDTIHAIQTSRRPLRVTFHRVEGLMRGWNT